jgi:hypothetical protein
MAHHYDDIDHWQFGRGLVGHAALNLMGVFCS